MTIVEQLKELRQLVDDGIDGILSEEEFKAEKEKLMNSSKTIDGSSTDGSAKSAMIIDNVKGTAKEASAKTAEFVKKYQRMI